MAEAREDYYLPEEELRRHFDERVRDFVFSGYAPQDRPVLILVGGQPAAGKSQAMAGAEQRHAGSQLVPLTGDELRAFHPRYAELLADHPLLFPNATGQASGAWVRMPAAGGRSRNASRQRRTNAAWTSTKSAPTPAAQAAVEAVEGAAETAQPSPPSPWRRSDGSWTLTCRTPEPTTIPSPTH